jgi:hypothetical protein
LCVPSFKIEDTSEYADITIYSTGYAKFLDLGYVGFGVCNDNIKNIVFIEQISLISISKTQLIVIKKH